jgi:hypothetical protein
LPVYTPLVIDTGGGEDRSCDTASGGKTLPDTASGGKS